MNTWGARQRNGIVLQALRRGYPPNGGDEHLAFDAPICLNPP